MFAGHHAVGLAGKRFAPGVSLGPLDRIGRWGFVGYVLLVALIWVAALQGTPPPSTGAVAWAGLTSWLFPFWAAWFDRHRGSAEPAGRPAARGPLPSSARR